jgi:1-acyl-sn-glycerol-3-phosphate acyltransferase
VEQEAAAESARVIAGEHPFLRLVVHGTQIVVYPLLVAIRLFIVRNNLKRDFKNLNPGGDDARYVLYANHQSKLDPFVICASLPSKAVLKLLPFRFFVENSYFKGGILANLLTAMGGFPAHYVEGKSYGLDRARALMGNDQTIMIFPPGTRTRERIAKPGISMLALEPNTFLIPAHIDWKHRFLCHVRIGAPVKLETTQPPEQLMRRVYDLHSQ